MVALFSTGAAPILGLAVLLIVLAALIHEIRRFARSPQLATFVGLMVLVLASAVAGRVTWGVSPMGDSALLRAHTRLALPPWPSNLYYYDNADSYVIAHMLIDPVQARALPAGTHILLDSGSADEVRHWFDRKDLQSNTRICRVTSQGARAGASSRCDSAAVSLGSRSAFLPELYEFVQRVVRPSAARRALPAQIAA